MVVLPPVPLPCDKCTATRWQAISVEPFWGRAGWSLCGVRSSDNGRKKNCCCLLKCNDSIPVMGYCYCSTESLPIPSSPPGFARHHEWNLRAPCVRMKSKFQWKKAGQGKQSESIASSSRLVHSPFICFSNTFLHWLWGWKG